MYKTYVELEREAYISGNTDLADLYAKILDQDELDSNSDNVQELEEQLGFANSTIELLEDEVQILNQEIKELKEKLKNFEK